MIWFSQIFHFPSNNRYVRTTSKFTRQALILSGKNLAGIIHWIDSCLSKWFELDHACIGQVLQRSSKCNYVLEVCVWIFNHEKKKTLPRVLSLGYGWNRSAKNNDHYLTRIGIRKELKRVSAIKINWNMLSDNLEWILLAVKIDSWITDDH